MVDTPEAPAAIDVALPYLKATTEDVKPLHPHTKKEPPQCELPPQKLDR